jgi:hypothetical protein
MTTREKPEGTMTTELTNWNLKRKVPAVPSSAAMVAQRL